MEVQPCTERTRVSNIKVEEGARSATISNRGRRWYLRIKVDKCLPIQGPRADFVVERDRAAVIVELKGRGIEYGAEQVDATCTLWTKTLQRADRVCGLIVGICPPKARPSILVKQDRFKTKFGGPLHVVRENTTYEFDQLFSFKGPRKRS